MYISRIVRVRMKPSTIQVNRNAIAHEIDVNFHAR